MILVLSACGGGGSGSPTPARPAAASPAGPSGGGTPGTPAGGGTTTSKATLTVSMHIAGSGRSTASRSTPQFVSPNTNGVEVDVYAHSDVTHSTILGSSQTDVSATSAACKAAGTGRTCTIVIPAPAGADDLVFTTYDAAPLAASPYWTGAHTIGSGIVFNQTVSLGAQNNVVVTLGGVIAQLVAPFSEPIVAGSPISFPVNFNALDASNAAIIADPFSVPVSASLTETGGSGHMTISVNGGPAGQTATINTPSDQLNFNYDGGGAPGYFATITLTSGSLTKTTTIDPFYVTSSSDPYFTGGASPKLKFTGAAQQAVLSISENGYTFQSSNVFNDTCSPNNIATLAPLAPGTPSSTLTITSGTVGGPCSFVLTDASANAIVVNVTGTGTGASITIPKAVSITEYGTPTANSAPAYITGGSDGNLYAIEQFGSNLVKISADGAMLTEIPTGGCYAVSISNGTTPDGDIYFNDPCLGIMKYSPVTSTFTSVNSAVTKTLGLAFDSLNNFWYTGYYGNKINKVASGGAATSYPIPTANSHPSTIAVDKNGDIWFGELGAQKIGKVTAASGVITEYTVNDSVFGITIGPDGNIWFTEENVNKIGTIKLDGTGYSEYAVPTYNSVPYYITTGPDGNLWFTELYGSKIGVVTTTGQIKDYPVPTAGGQPEGITSFNGAIWFGEANSNKVGKLVP